MTALAKPHELQALRNGPLLRWAMLRGFLPLDAKRREGAQELFPDVPERRAWAAAQLLWSKIQKADAVAVWNGTRNLPYAAVRIARAQNKPVVYVENGLLPSTYQVDLCGINAASSLRHLTPDQLRQMPLTDEALQAIEDIQFRQRPLGRDTGHEAKVSRDCNLPADYILFAAQVHDDSQIKRFSPDFPTVEAAIRYTAAEAAAAGRALIVKEHPSDHGRIDYSQLKADLPEVRFYADADNAILVDRCGALVTVNSSMAMQAIRAGKPVFTLGDAVYNMAGVAERIRAPRRLREALENPFVDDELRRRYLAFLTSKAMVPCKSRIPDDVELKAVLDRMLELLRSEKA